MSIGTQKQSSIWINYSIQEQVLKRVQRWHKESSSSVSILLIQLVNVYRCISWVQLNDWKLSSLLIAISGPAKSLLSSTTLRCNLSTIWKAMQNEDQLTSLRRRNLKSLAHNDKRQSSRRSSTLFERIQISGLSSKFRPRQAYTQEEKSHNEQWLISWKPSSN